MAISDTELNQLLAELEYLAPDDLKRAGELAKAEGISLYDALIKSDLISNENLGKVIAYSLKLPFVALSQLTVPEEILKITPQALVTQHHTLAFMLDDKSLSIATTDPSDTELFDMLAKKAGSTHYKLFYATEQDLEDALRLYKKQLGEVFQGLVDPSSGALRAPISTIVDTMIDYAYTSKASDIHIEPRRTASLVRFRIDGVLHDIVRLPRTVHEQIIARIKVLSRLRTDEHFSAQDGRMRTTVEDDQELDIRVSIVPIVPGEKIVMRLLASHYRQFGLTDLGMNQKDLEKVHSGFTRPYGMVLSTGPTGSGKTTSMYAILKIINTREKNIATIEDPVEYEIEGINQIQANPKTNLTFAAGLRSILRQDPNVIYVGEIRDEETADIAINSAMTGHLVLSTLHTNDAATALPRLIDMKIEPFLVASTVNVIIAQRLIRTICNRCKMSLEITKDSKGWQGDPKTVAQLSTLNPKIIAKYFGNGPSIRLYRGKGCPVCHNTGYIGRIGIFEVLEISPAIEQLIVQKADSEAIARQAIADGMTTMLDDGLSKVQQGITTIEEVVRATRE